MGNIKDTVKAKTLIEQGRKKLWAAWELLPDGENRKKVTRAIQAINGIDLNQITGEKNPT